MYRVQRNLKYVIDIAATWDKNSIPNKQSINKQSDPGVTLNTEAHLGSI